MALGMTLNAAVITSNCTGAGVTSAGTINLTCTSFGADPGNNGSGTLSNFTANLIGNWSDGFGGTSHAFSYSFNFAPPLTLATTLNSAASSGSTGSTGATLGAAVAGTSQAFNFTPGPISVDVAAILGTSFGTASATAQVQVNADQASVASPTPEPNTFALIGPVLIGLGTIIRRGRS